MRDYKVILVGKDGYERMIEKNLTKEMSEFISITLSKEAVGRALSDYRSVKMNLVGGK